MIRDLWAKLGLGRSERESSAEGRIQTDDFSGTSDGAVVPLRSKQSSWGRPDTAVVSRNDSAEKVNEAIHRLVEKLEGIHEHLGEQTRHNEQLLEKVSRLPDLIQSLPESQGRQEQAIRSLINDLRAKSVRDGELMELVARIPAESARQTKALGEIHGYLSKMTQNEERIAEQFAHTSETLDKLDLSTMKQTEWVEQMSRSFSLSDRYLRYTLIRQQKQFYWILGITILLSLTALAGLGIVIFMLNKGA